MLNEMLILMRQELGLIILFLLLLLMKLGKDRSNDSILGFIHICLFINLLLGFTFLSEEVFYSGDVQQCSFSHCFQIHPQPCLAADLAAIT